LLLFPSSKPTPGIVQETSDLVDVLSFDWMIGRS
jgi:hypothetical protein